MYNQTELFNMDETILVVEYLTKLHLKRVGGHDEDFITSLTRPNRHLSKDLRRELKSLYRSFTSDDTIPIVEDGDVFKTYRRYKALVAKVLHSPGWIRIVVVIIYTTHMVERTQDPIRANLYICWCSEFIKLHAGSWISENGGWNALSNTLPLSGLFKFCSFMLLILIYLFTI
jgi:hypothetical protein